MSVLRISLFGGLHIAQDDGPALCLPTHSTELLFSYLLVHRGRMHARDVLAGTFWGDATDERARACLSTALWRLRSVLEPTAAERGTYVCNARGGELGFNVSGNHWLDIEVFERVCQKLNAGPLEELRVEDAAAFKSGLELYTAELLPGVYAEWALRERERLHCLMIKSLARLMALHALHGSYDDAVSAAQRLLSLDPLREEVHRELMRLYARVGQRPLALRQYEICCTQLRTELGIGPMPETRALCSSLLADRAAAGEAPAGAGAKPRALPEREDALWQTLRNAARQLGAALRGIEAATIQLERVCIELQEAEQASDAGLAVASGAAVDARGQVVSRAPPVRRL